MINQQLKYFLLESCPDASLVSAGREVLMKCRFCGDSAHSSSRHLYISVDDEKPFYNCFKCRQSGVITTDFLSMITHQNLDSDLITSVNKAIKGYNTQRKVMGTTKFNLRWDWIDDTELNRTKLAYINRRMGLNLDYAELIRNKFVLSLYDLLIQNNIDKVPMRQSSLEDLNNCFLGAISMNNGFVTLKNLAPGKVDKAVDHKYYDFQIFPEPSNNRRMYSIPTVIDITNPEPIQVHIAEGIFDVLGIFYHICDANRHQQLYINCGDKSYSSVVKMLNQTYGLLNCEYNFYIDNDVPDSEVYIETLGAPYRIFRNGIPGEKDYGVTKDRIKNIRYV